MRYCPPTKKNECEMLNCLRNLEGVISLRNHPKTQKLGKQKLQKKHEKIFKDIHYGKMQTCKKRRQGRGTARGRQSTTAIGGTPRRNGQPWLRRSNGGWGKTLFLALPFIGGVALQQQRQCQPTPHATKQNTSHSRLERQPQQGYTNTNHNTKWCPTKISTDSPT